MSQSEVMADVFPPVELEIGLDKVACDIDEVIDAVILTLSDFKKLFKKSVILGVAIFKQLSLKTEKALPKQSFIICLEVAICDFKY